MKVIQSIRGRKMRIIIKSRNFGEQSFWMPDAGGYLWKESDGRPGTLGHQLTDGSGSTLRASPESFKKAVNRWWRKRRVHLMEYGE
jgi:hypothetical protein